MIARMETNLSVDDMEQLEGRDDAERRIRA